MMSTRFTTQNPTPYSFLVIGYGNHQHGDNAVGAQVAEAVVQWHLPDVKALVVHQLMPELALEVIKASYVIFIDACGKESCARNVKIEPITLKAGNTPAGSTLVPTHSAQGLLRLTEQIYRYTPQAWLLQVPSENFDSGQQLSATAKHGCDQALRIIERFLITYRATPQSTQKSAGHTYIQSA